MSRDASNYIAPTIAPVCDMLPRQRWSVMIPTFNCAKYLRHTLRSVLDQAPGPDQMQIEVIDDCSTRDDPYAVVRELASGRIQFYRKEQNGGATTNFNTCIQRSRGELVHILHGDDTVSPGFFKSVERAADKHPEIAGFFARTFDIDEEGNLQALSARLPWLESGGSDSGELLYQNSIRTPGCVVRRKFYEVHGGFLPGFPHVADWEMWVRVIANGGGLAINEPLANYRDFAANDTGRLARLGANVRDGFELALRFKETIPTFDFERARRQLAAQAREQMKRFRERNDSEAADANEAVYREIRGAGGSIVNRLMLASRRAAYAFLDGMR